MEKRDVLKDATGVISENNKVYGCKITVLKKSFHEALYQAYPYGEAKSCGRFEEGQEFMTTNPWDPPEKFCHWAWGDLRAIIHSMHAGNSTVMIVSCTDGLRPVLFKLERVEV